MFMVAIAIFLPVRDAPRWAGGIPAAVGAIAPMGKLRVKAEHSDSAG